MGNSISSLPDLTNMDLNDQTVKTALVAAAALISSYVVVKKLTGPKYKLPPGPSALPLLGNVMQMPSDIRDLPTFFTEMHKIYGPIVTLYMGSQRMVTLGDPAMIKEAFVANGEYTSHRPPAPWIAKHEELDLSLVIGQEREELWKNMRRFCLSAMRDFGVGKNTMEGKIHDELDWLCREMENSNGKAFNMKDILFPSITNVIASVCFGSRFDNDDQKFKDLVFKLIYIFKQPFINLRPVNFFPPLRLFPYPKSLRNHVQYAKDLLAYVDEQVEEHRLDYDPNNMRDMVDLFIKHESSDTILSRKELRGLIIDLFIAGSETTTSTIRWCLLFAILNPNLQKKCQEEIDQVVGRGRYPQMSDRAKMPYVDAFIHESMRLANVASVTALHVVVNKDIKLGGFDIPKDTFMMASIMNMHLTESEYKDCDKFNPERWLDGDGKLTKSDYFMPFGMGPRICAGETLAKSEIFIFTAALLQKFTIIQADESRAPTTKIAAGLTRMPEEECLRVKLR